MSICPKILKCPFFNDKMKNMPATSTLFKDSYCKKDFNTCARYIVATSGSTQVPLDLFPNQSEKLKDLI